jgi:hypothetical protein
MPLFDIVSLDPHPQKGRLPSLAKASRAKERRETSSDYTEGAG